MITDILKIFEQKELAKIWKVKQNTVSYKLKHGAVSIGEYHLVIKAYPEKAEVLLTALK